MWEEEAKGIRRDEEEALLDLIEQRAKNVEKIGRAIAYYTCEVYLLSDPSFFFLNDLMPLFFDSDNG